MDIFKWEDELIIQVVFSCPYSSLDKTKTEAKTETEKKTKTKTVPGPELRRALFYDCIIETT